MKEQLIIFKTAKLAKEKGFNLLTPKYYTTENPHSYHKDLEGVCILGLMHCNTLYQPQDEVDKKTNISLYKLNPAIVYAPTQSLLQRWLREIHSIILWVQPVTGVSEYEQYEFMYCIEQMKSNEGESGASKGMNWEETFEYGLQEALRLI